MDETLIASIGFAVGALVAGLTTVLAALIQRRSGERTWLREQQVAAYRDGLAATAAFVTRLMEPSKETAVATETSRHLQLSNVYTSILWATALSKN